MVLKMQLKKEQQRETLPQRAAKTRLSCAALVPYTNTAVPESQDGCKDGCLPKGIYFSCNFVIFRKDISRALKNDETQEGRRAAKGMEKCRVPGETRGVRAEHLCACPSPVS